VKLNVEQLRSALGELLISAPTGHSDIETKDFIYDSREVRASTIFVALSGENFDGNTFVTQALSQGATAALCTPSAIDEFGAARHLCWVVTDTRQAIQQLALFVRKQCRAKVIAITGSVGKTSIKELLGFALSFYGPTLSAEGSFNNEYGVPRTLLKIDDSYDFVVLEFGARKNHDIRVLCEIALPDFAVGLNALSAHLEVFGSYENLLKTKSEIFQDSPQTAQLICTHDQQDILNNARNSGKKLRTFSAESQEATVCCQNLTWPDSGGMSFELSYPENRSTLLEVKTDLAHEVYPLHCATVTAITLSLELSTAALKEIFNSYSGAKRRFEIHNIGSLCLVDDAYNANPESMLSGLKSFMHMSPEDKKWLILGDMKELGEASEAQHYELGVIVGRLYNDALVNFVGEMSCHFMKGLKSSSPTNSSSRAYSCVQELLKDQGHELQSFSGAIFLKASNAMKFIEILNFVKAQGAP
jgi:UDP-N-acetylmuramoyl-tripeptide--D-alanyl-D-alanine ligase